jgi:hypothetical protein
MADVVESPSSGLAPPSPPTIYEAERLPGWAIEYGVELTLIEAIDRRKRGLDTVVRGVNQIDNRKVAQQIEAGVGGVYKLHAPHKANTLPHYQQAIQPPEGHCFYELDSRKARRKQ